MRPGNSVALTFFAVFLSTVAAMGYEPVTATVRVSSGALYDYVVIGQNRNATDGFDNAYDTISPGNLNADMDEPFISTVIPHPEWRLAVKEFRGDIRAPAVRQQWQVTLTSSLPRGTALSLELQQDRTTLPRGMKLMVEGEGWLCEPGVAPCQMKAPGPGKRAEFSIITEQPQEEKP